MEYASLQRVDVPSCQAVFRLVSAVMITGRAELKLFNPGYGLLNDQMKTRWGSSHSDYLLIFTIRNCRSQFHNLRTLHDQRGNRMRLYALSHNGPRLEDAGKPHQFLRHWVMSFKLGHLYLVSQDPIGRQIP
jgi:hypothetical protein